VPTLTWGALGFFLFVLLAGTVATAVTGLALWRQVKAVEASSGKAVGELADALELLEAKVPRVERKTAELERAISRLERSLRRAKILLAAYQDARGTIAGWLRLIPR
jgi:hypothetical protein